MHEFSWSNCLIETIGFNSLPHFKLNGSIFPLHRGFLFKSPLQCYLILAYIKVLMLYILILHINLERRFKLCLYWYQKAKSFAHRVLIRLPHAQVKDVNHGDSVLQTGGQTLVRTRNHHVHWRG
ncbi:hypothetical protein M9H77_17431 [Catharanthus roseus]|uniref:Uncharacterized protein n=1 Tax=Catharanthus roseus TaxID=4058 RepID=A0ACC0B4K8_CATRO|nr:hypothetical protein M9H77_17431 [Catharanthus roseus]